MIPHSRPKPPAPAKDVTPPGPSKLVEFCDVDFSFGVNDLLQITLGPGDEVEIKPDAFYLSFADGERVEVDRSKVRWWSKRTRTVAVPQELLAQPVE